ncbi:MAG: HAMP domain-containing protein [Cyanobacteria bacterium SBLK]|nr:HAMP domain-containing protein [Cyanobacteria bacterium SBLK]
MLLSVSLTSIGIIGYLSWNRSRAALTATLFEHLTSLRTSKGHHIEAYFEDVSNQLHLFSEDREIISSMVEFNKGFKRLNRQHVSEEIKDAVQEFYENEYFPRLTENLSGEPTYESYHPDTQAAEYLQYHYIVTNEHPIGEKDLLFDAEDGSDYSEFHRRHHPFFEDVIKKSGYEDLFLINHKTGDIVYSTHKEVDFGTNIDTGPYRRSSLAEVVEKVRDNPEKGAIQIADFKIYRPSFGKPAVFLAAPIYNGPHFIGIIAVELALEKLDRVISDEGDWEGDGLGKTGEVYLVGPDFLMRSDSRFVVETSKHLHHSEETEHSQHSEIEKHAENSENSEDSDESEAAASREDSQESENSENAEKTENSETPKRYRDYLMGGHHNSEQTLNLIENLGTTVLLQKVDTEAVREAFEGNEGIQTLKGYRGIEVLSSYAPLDIHLEGMELAIVAEMELDEVYRPIYNLQTYLLISTVLLILFITAIAIAIATRFVKPIETLIEAVDRVKDGDFDTEVKMDTEDEFSTLTTEFNKMIDSIRNQRTLVQQKDRENDALLLNILPNSIATRLRKGEAEIADYLPQVAVLVAEVKGFNSGASQAKEVAKTVKILNEIVQAFDEAADRLDVEKIKTLGEHYIAACGATKPHLDREKRIADFAVEMTQILRKINVEKDLSLTVKISIHTGTAIAAILGRKRFTYDVWGEAIDIAVSLNEYANPDTILATQDAYERLKDLYAFETGQVLSFKDKEALQTWVLKNDTNTNQFLTDLAKQNSPKQEPQTILPPTMRSNGNSDEGRNSANKTPTSQAVSSSITESSTSPLHKSEERSPQNPRDMVQIAFDNPKLKRQEKSSESKKLWTKITDPFKRSQNSDRS